jgi:hypothetical protein
MTRFVCEPFFCYYIFFFVANSPAISKTEYETQIHTIFFFLSSFSLYSDEGTHNHILSETHTIWMDVIEVYTNTKNI